MRTPKWFVFVGVIFLSTAASILAQTPGWEQHPGGDAALEQITFIHGGAGPFAVAGYRIGERALKELKVPRGAFSLDVVHKTPNEVQWSCIADGVQTATGVSLGKLNLKLEETSPDRVETVIQDRKSGRTLVFRLKPEFVKRYLNLPPEKLSKAGKEVLSLPNDQIFSMSIPRTPSPG